MEAIHGACSTSQPSLLARSCTRSSRPFCLVRARQPHDLWRHRAGERNGAPVTTVPAPTVSRPAMSERSMSSAQPEEQQSTSLWWLAVPLVAALATVPLGLDPIGAYTTALANHPFSTKLATGVAGAFVGDFIAQAAPALIASLKSKQSGRTVSDAPVFKYDALRAARFMLFSAVIATPINVAWFNFLDGNIMPHDPTNMQAVATKVAMDQLMMSPVMTSTFFAFMAAMQGQASKAPEIVRAKIVPTMKMNYMLWPAAHVLNFAFVPSDQRILFVNVVALAWNLILSSAAAAPAPASKASGSGK